MSLSKLVNSYASTFDEKKIFEIIGLDKQGYCVHVSNYYSVIGTSIVEKKDCKNYKIDIKYLDEQMLYVVDTQIFSIYSILDGCMCSRCKEFYHQASPNQEDGTMICYLCRFNPHR